MLSSSQTTESFIRNCLLAKSLEEEKVIIADEQAHLRTFIRDCSEYYKPRAISKILFLYTRGHNVAWAQIEIIKLITHERFSFKSLAYLACSLLIDETNETSILLTQAVQKDLSSPNPMVQSCALTLASNMGTSDMFQTINADVLRLLSSSIPNIQKRAALCAVRILKKFPEFADSFAAPCSRLFDSIQHSVVAAGIVLGSEILKLIQPDWARYQPFFTRVLLGFYKAGPTSEFKFAGFNDPFLMIRVLQLLGDLKLPTDELDEVLNQIVTGIDRQKVTGRSILLATVEAIGQTAKKSSLKSLAFNQIGRLFEHKTPNILYSALSCFSKILYEGKRIIDRSASDSLVLERYKSSVVTCLDHPDPSLRRRALDVVAALIDARNIETLIPELMTYIKLADSDFRVELTSKIFAAVQRFAPSARWNFETVLNLLSNSGSFIENNVITSVCHLIGSHLEIRDIVLTSLSNALTVPRLSQPLIVISSWSLGEFLETDINGSFDRLFSIFNLPSTEIETKCYILTALTKLGHRFKRVEEVISLLAVCYRSSNIELQQRAGELGRILRTPSLCDLVLAPLDFEDQSQPLPSGEAVEPITGEVPPTVASQSSPSLIDLLSGPSKTSSTEINQNLQPQSNIVIPPGAVEALKNPSYVVYFQIQRKPDNPNLFHVMSTTFGLEKIALTKFQMMFAVSKGWKISISQPTGDVLGEFGSIPIKQQIFLMCESPMPLELRTQTTYFYRSQPMKDFGVINPLFN